MAVPNSRDTLIDYCLRALGAPVIEINVDDDQISDRVDEALQFYQHYHADAIEKVFLKHQITQTDIDNKYLTLSNLITEVIRVLPIRDTMSSNTLFDIKYQMHLNDMFSLGYMGSLLEYSMAQQYLSTLDMVIDSDSKFSKFDKHQNRLEIYMKWDEEVNVNDFIVVEAYRIIDPNSFTEVYNDYYLKKYLTALLKRQWGSNLLKFEGMQLPGGVVLNGRQIFEDGTADIERLRENLRLEQELPPDFFVG